MGRFDDIIDHEYDGPKRHKPMPAMNRAAQFAPFSALTGYDEAIDEVSRYTEARAVLSSDERMMLDRRLQYALEHIADNPTLVFRVFVPDGRKAGGTYATVSGVIRSYDETEGALHLHDGRVIPVDSIQELHGTIFTGI